MNISRELMKVAKMLLNEQTWQKTEFQKESPLYHKDGYNGPTWHNVETDEYRYQFDKPLKREEKKRENRKDFISDENMYKLSQVYGYNMINLFLEICSDQNIRAETVAKSVDNFIKTCFETEDNLEDFSNVVKSKDAKGFVDKY